MLRYKKIIALMLLFVAVFGYVQHARAQANAFAPFIAVAPVAAGMAAGSGLVVSALASTGAVVGAITPVGWFVIGAAVIGSAYMYFDEDSPTGKTTAIVHTAPPSVQPNPDLETGGGAAPAVSTPAQFQVSKTGLAEPYLYFDTSECARDGLLCSNQSNARPSVIWNNFYSKLSAYLKTYYGTTLSGAYAVKASSGSAECSTDTASQSYGGPAGWCVRIIISTAPGSYGTLTSANYNWTNSGSPGAHATFRTGSGSAVECDSATSYYDYNMSSCLHRVPSSSQSLADGYCNVSFSDKGNPVFNPFDSDCARMTSAGALALSNGNTSNAPSVTVRDPVTGEVVTTSRPAIASQGVVGSVAIRDRVSDPASGTTKDRTVLLNPPASVGQAPTTAGLNDATYPGVGVGTGASPIGQVAVSNWPTTMKVSGSVVCENCTQSAPIVNVNTPDTIKIDSEGKSEADLPNPELELAKVQADAGAGVLSPVQEKLSAFTAFSPPAHSAECPVIRIHWTAYIDIDVTSSGICDVLETPSIKTVFQGGMMLLYILAGIFIILGA